MPILPSPRTAWQVVEGNPARRTRREGYYDNRPNSDFSDFTIMDNRNFEYLVEMFPEDIPQVRPLQTNAVHIVVRDLDQLLQTEQARLL